MRDVIDFLKMNDVKYVENVSLCRYSSIKIGGDCDLVAFPSSKSQLVPLAHFLGKNKIRYKILGRMSNVLPPDEDYHSVVIKTDLIRGIIKTGNLLSVNIGETLPVLSNALIELKLSGMEELSGIPGSIGGAIAGNAGAFGREISDLITEIEFYDPKTDTIGVIGGQEAKFSYRNSLFKNTDQILLSARFKLLESSSEKIKSRLAHYRKIRKDKQPCGIPSLGSVFKRPGNGLYAAKMIDECGLRGCQIGGAQISTKHAGFIVNVGGATSADYLALTNYVERRVFERFGIRLEREIEIL